MYIEIDLSAVPPVSVLHNPDDFTSFKVVVRQVEHARVPAEVIQERLPTTAPAIRNGSGASRKCSSTPGSTAGSTTAGYARTSNCSRDGHAPYGRLHQLI